MEIPIKQKQTSSTRGSGIVAPALFYAAAKLQPCKQTEASALPCSCHDPHSRPRPPSILACLAVSTVVLAAPTAFLAHETYKEVNIAIKSNVAAGGKCCIPKTSNVCPSDVYKYQGPCLPRFMGSNLRFYECFKTSNYEIDNNVDSGYLDCSNMLGTARACPANTVAPMICMEIRGSKKGIGMWIIDPPGDGDRDPVNNCKSKKYIPLKVGSESNLPQKDCGVKK